MRSAYFTILFILLFVLTGPAIAGDISFTVKNLRSKQGVLVAAVYDRAETFGEKGKQVTGVKVPVDDHTVSGTISDLPNGTYAIVFFHDENNNNKMDFNFFGLPKEDYAFSSNSYGVFGSKPKFSKAAIEVDDQGATVTVEMNEQPGTMEPAP